MRRSQPNTEGSAIARFRSKVPGGYLLAISLLCNGLRVTAADDIAPVVEVEEDIYSYTNAQNGAGPMWCTGSTTLVRTGDRLFASGLETIPDAKPLNNCRWMLFLRENNGWTRVRVDADGRTREPSPLAAFADGRLFLSVNPTLGKGPEPNGGPARPDVLQFNAAEPTAAPSIAGTSMARQAGVHGTFLQDVRRRRCTRGTAPLSEHRLHARRMDISRRCRQVERPGPAQVALGYRACQARPHPRLLSQRGAPRSRGALRRGKRRARAQPGLAQVQA